MTLFEKFCWYTESEQSVKMTPEERYGVIYQIGRDARGVQIPMYLTN